MMFLVLYIFLLIIYGFVGYHSPGYDDEFFNINLIEKFGLSVLHVTQSTDVHPPGSYFSDWALYKIFGEWEYVRASIGLLTAASLVSGVNYIKRNKGDLSGFLCFIVFGLNPAYLLWCTGLRWYAYFVPILIFLLQVPEKRNSYYWAKCFLGLTLLGYIGYAAFIIAPGVIILYWLMDKADVKVKLKEFSIWAAISIVMYAYQLNIFFTVHLHNKDGQVAGLLQSIAGVFIANFSNQGVFPLSFAGIVTLVGTLGMTSMIFHSQLKLRVKNEYTIPYLLTTLVAITTGLAGKFRNLVVVSPVQGYWILTSVTESIYKKKLFKFLMGLLLIGNAWGVVNVALHQNTTKNSWNMTVQIILKELDKAEADCTGKHLFLSSDPSLSWHIKKAHHYLIGPMSEVSFSNVNNKYDCLTVIKTYKATLTEQKYKSMYDEISMVKADRSKYKKIGKDEFYLVKKILDSAYPEYQVEITTYYNITYLPEFKAWLP